jgi:hypothetical protein
MAKNKQQNNRPNPSNSTNGPKNKQAYTNRNETTDHVDVEKQLGMQDDLLYNGDFAEETASEFAVPVQRTREPIYNRETNEVTENGQGIGWTAIALSIISLFVLPVLLGAAGIIVGFIARRQGAETLGSWAIGIGAVSIIIRLFIAPFF